MEQSGGAWKSQIIILSLGGALALAFAAAHFFSPVSRRLSANEDIEIALLSPSRPMLFVYRPGAASVDAVRLPKKAARSDVSATGLATADGSALQRAHGALGLLLKDRSGVRAPAFYIEVAEPDLERFSVMLNTWRNGPGQIPAIAAYIRDLKRTERTNLSWHDILGLSLELSRLRWADFIITDPPGDFFDKAGTSQKPPPSAVKASAPAPESPAVRLEVLNASGRKDLAGRVTRYLRKKGFDVISFGNYRAAQKRTKIVNCSDNVASARLVRSALGLKDLEIYSKVEKPAVVQVRVILGADFDEAGTESPAFFKKEGGR